MRNVLAHIVAILAAIALAGCASTKPSTSSSLNDTSWAGLTAKEDTLNFEFHRGGRLTDNPGTGTWQQQGDEVTMTANYGNGDVTYKGTIRGNTITGTARNAADKTWSWRVNRRK